MNLHFNFRTDIFKNWVFLYISTFACCCLVAQPCPTLCNLMDCSMPGFMIVNKFYVSSGSSYSLLVKFILRCFMVLLLWRDDIPFMIIFSTRLLSKEIILTCLLLVTFLNISNTSITHFIVLCFIVIHRYWVFHKRKVRGNSVKQVYWCHVSNSMCSLHVSVLQLGNSRNISNFFIIIILVMVICDLWCYYCKNITTYWKLKWWLAFFTNNIFKLKHTHLKKISYLVVPGLSWGTQDV